MANPSNLYSEKIFSEHPVALWSLDEQADFISYFSIAEKSLTSWTKSGTASATSTVTSYTSYDTPIYPPVNISPTKITKTFTTSETSTVTFASSSKSISGSTVSFYIYSNSSDVQSVSVQVGSQTVQTEYISTKPNTWLLISKTFADATSTSAVTISINFNRTTASAGSASIYIDSINYGYLSEEFNGATGGITVSSISDGTLSGYQGLTAYAYASSTNKGYYISDSFKLFAKNKSMPMVYGANNSTILYQNTNGSDSSPLPSVVLPGMGFMAAAGSNKEYTFESWFRINSKSTVFRRIFGPIASTDGLYVKGSFLYLKVGNNMKAHHVGEWFRPMLVDITLSKNGASLFINGEKVFTIVTDLVSAFASNTIQDWLGFYAYSDVASFEIDAVAIYPYAVSEILSKRRFAYGQATEYPISLDAYYGGTSVATDYSVANYANDYNYPDIANWSTGISENFSIKQNYITVPEYSLADIKINSTSLTSSKLLSDNYAIQSGSSFINLVPNSNWTSINSYLYYGSLSVMNDQVSSIQGAFASPGTAPSSNQTLFMLQNKVNGDYIKAYINGTTVKYDASFSGTVTTVKTITGVTAGSQFAVGLNINVLKAANASYRQFFAIPSQIQVFIGGENATGTFAGKIYNFGFSTNRNLSKISSYFDANGFMTYTNAASLISFTSSYTLFLNVLQGYAELDIAVNSYWQDYVPLTVIGKYVVDSSGNQVFNLDTVQFNIDYPELPIYSGSNYDTSSAILKTYATFQYLQNGANKDILDSLLTTAVSASKYGTVDPASTWAVSKYEIVNGMVLSPPISNFDSGKTVLDLALVLHLEANIPGINNSPLKIKYLQLASRSLNYGVGTATNQIGTKFGKDIYAYKTVSGTRDYQAKNQIKIGKTQNPYLYLTSQSGIQLSGTYDSTIDRGIYMTINDRKASKYSISNFQLSTLYTQDVFPTTPNKIFEISGTSKNRFYVTQSNVTTRGKIFGTQVGATVTGATGSGTVVTYTTSTDHGLVVGDVVSITAILPSAYQLYNMTIASVPTTTTFTVSNSATGTYSSPGNVEKHVSSEITFMLNGNIVREPYINAKEWNTLSIVYTSFLQLDNSIGEFVLTGPMLLNNLSYYTVDSSLSGQQLVQRTWGTIASSSITWAGAKTYSITGASPSWQTFGLSSISISYALDPAYVYKIFIGNNKIISDANKNAGMVKFKSFEYKTYLGSQSTYSYFTPA